MKELDGKDLHITFSNDNGAVHFMVYDAFVDVDDGIVTITSPHDNNLCMTVSESSFTEDYDESSGMKEYSSKDIIISYAD